jgi:hypothetical protein
MADKRMVEKLRCFMAASLKLRNLVEQPAMNWLEA